MSDTPKITVFGLRIFQACPSSNSVGISERELIEEVHGLAAYADYQRGIKELVDAGYLTQDPETKRYRRSS